MSGRHHPLRSAGTVQSDPGVCFRPAHQMPLMTELSKFARYKRYLPWGIVTWYLPPLACVWEVVDYNPFWTRQTIVQTGCANCITAHILRPKTTDSDSLDQCEECKAQRIGWVDIHPTANRERAEARKREAAFALRVNQRGSRLDKDCFSIVASYMEDDGPFA